MKVNDAYGNTQDIRGAAQYIPSSFLAPVISSGGTAYSTRIADAIGRVLVSGARWIAERHARHQMRRELERLSNHTLKDLGFTRGQIDSAVESAFAKKPARGIEQFTNTAILRTVPTAANDDTVTRAA
jgi:uncharacterized protein YjiS (DUF1127 family)